MDETGAIIAIPREMKWGTTPWDDLPREELMREIKRMYSALEAAYGVMNLARLGDKHAPFWAGVDGSGRLALEKTNQVLRSYKNRSDDIYRAFFRYADDLLFDGLGRNWMVGDCGDMITCHSVVGPVICPVCKQNGKGEVPMRRITWDDLKPQTGGTP